MHRYKNIFNFRIIFVTSRISLSEMKIGVEHKMFVSDFFEGVVQDKIPQIFFFFTIIWLQHLNIESNYTCLSWDHLNEKFARAVTRVN